MFAFNSRPENKWKVINIFTGPLFFLGIIQNQTKGPFSNKCNFPELYRLFQWKIFSDHILIDFLLSGLGNSRIHVFRAISLFKTYKVDLRKENCYFSEGRKHHNHLFNGKSNKKKGKKSYYKDLLLLAPLFHVKKPSGNWHKIDSLCEPEQFIGFVNILIGRIG